MWRRVSCEQPLHTSQSILSPRQKPMSMLVCTHDTKILRESRELACSPARPQPSARTPRGDRGSVSRSRTHSDIHVPHPTGERESGSYSGTRQRNR